MSPAPGDFLLKWRGDTVEVSLRLDSPAKGRAALRTNLGHAATRRREIIAWTERGETPLARAWTDIPLEEKEPGVFSARITLDEVGVFSGKACFFPEGSNVPQWPEGSNFHIKVESAWTRRSNSIYTVFPRQFGSYRGVVRALPEIMDRMGFGIIQSLPPFPVPATYAVMGEYGCPFAALDFYSVDPAMAVFDTSATPMDQFRELIDAVHARRGRFMIDLPANHTGWASTLQTHHPEWFKRNEDGSFKSPGAWGVVWEDLVELDYSVPALRSYMADVFLFWCRKGVDGFRCDAGYMIPAETWEYIVAKVREEYPDTIFMLEGLGGDLNVTDALLAESNLDWAYSEIFQTFDRKAFEWYLPQAAARAERFGTLVHFAETHDNDRLAKGGETYAKMRVSLAALLSWQGAWGIANGVEWFATEKIDVHGKNDLNWGAERNMTDLIAKLNSILDSEETFSGPVRIELVTRGGGNVLAALRNGRTLVVANLDCGNSSDVSWDEAKFPGGALFDLLSGQAFETCCPMHLGPGEVRCLVHGASRGEAAGEAEKTEKKTSARPVFRWRSPYDAARDFVAPENETVEISADGHFRAALVDCASGKTVRSVRSENDADGTPRALFRSPQYAGDGTSCRVFSLEVAVYRDGKAKRSKSRFLVPPPGDAARVKPFLEASGARENPSMRAILSNTAGAASQMRAEWGRIESMYDAVLAANPSPAYPSDRLNIWARTRAWIQREGYTREFDSRVETCFRADPAGRFAAWEFLLPCGMGRTAAFKFTLSLASDANAARLAVERTASGETDVGDQVRLVFRPDIEWRSFHDVTKAYCGAETRFPASVKHDSSSFVFAPYEGSFEFRVKGGEYHHEPQWTYNVAHPEDAERGGEGAGDLFSPGWISADLKPGAKVVFEGEYIRKDAARKRLVYPKARETGLLSVPDALKESLKLFIVRRDALKTVIAGYPWFLDWGRDTFIFMRGMIAAGMIEESIDILEAFARFEEKGTLPNIIHGKTAGNRDTADAPLWFVRCVKELDDMGALPVSKAALLRKTCRSIVENYMAGTPNGIKTDLESMLVWSPSHFTWMDTNYPAATPREGYPVEIEALWISALDYTGFKDLAAKATASLEKLFRWEHGYRDVLEAPGGESAAAARPSDAIRPNQLFLVSLGVVDDRSIVEAVLELLVPGGIRTLQPWHRLYKGRYTGDEDTSRKLAYHNGTVWAWPFPMLAEALVSTGMASKETALAVLASAVENINSGALAHMSEICDGDSPHAQKGCIAQAWSESELLRVWLRITA
ncbi:MAG: glycogen debranching enzyme N-terminal domain-containing protein [Kiritimatiellae bacterium]|nr:glycogen debranching enzyme N-terminal domain-containing protein [Kiritimatiellia bacterium]